MDKQRKGFTLIELLVVIAIIALLMSILAPALTKVREQAKDALCMSRLHQWGAIFAMYADDNDGQLTGFHGLNPGDDTYGPPGDDPASWQWTPWLHESCWVPRLHHFYAEKLEYKQIGGQWKCQANWDFCMCPATSKTWADGEFGGPLTGWDFEWMRDQFIGWEHFPYYANAYGSYGKNAWVTESVLNEDTNPQMWYDLAELAWHNTRVRGVARIPLFGDCSMMGGFPDSWGFLTDDWQIPEERIRPPMSTDNEMARFVQDRHGLTINLVFLDFSVRKVGLKQLWRLSWHRNWDLHFAPDPKDLEIWPSWIRNAPMIELGF